MTDLQDNSDLDDFGGAVAPDALIEQEILAEVELAREMLAAPLAATGQSLREITEEFLTMSALEMENHAKSDSTRYSYRNIILRSIDLLTAEEKAEYINPDLELDGYKLLKKGMPVELVRRLLHTLSTQVRGQRGLASSSYVGQLTSSLNHWHKESNRLTEGSEGKLLVTPEVLQLFAIHIRSRKMILAKMRDLGIQVKDGDGKIALSFERYRILAQRALRNGTGESEARLSHLYLLLSWNLMTRCNSVGRLLWNSIGWSGDALTITYEKSKTNQEGINIVPRHVYANPLNPLICPVLALGVQLCSVSFLSYDRQDKVFNVKSPETSFSRWLSKHCKEIFPSGRSSLIGTHSIRKGSATYAMNVTNAPNGDAIKLRMEHLLGGCDDKYIFRGADADRVVGRCVNGLDSSSAEFATLPPHFATGSVVDLERVIAPAVWNGSTAEFKEAIPFLVASVIFHWDFLMANLHTNHPFRTSRIVSIKGKELWGDMVSTGIFRSANSDLRASGVPNAIYLLVANMELQRSIDALRGILESNPQITTNLILSQISSAHNVQILNTRIVTDIVGEAVAGINANCQMLMAQMNETLDHVRHANPNAIALDRANPRANYRTYPRIYTSLLQYVPPNFKMPRINSLSLWKLWLFGDPGNAEVTAPYHLIVPKTLPRSQQGQFSKGKQIMELIRSKTDKSYEQLIALGEERAMDEFINAFDQLFSESDVKPRHHYSMVYKAMRQF